MPDPARQDELKTLAERLNPDTWVTPDEVRAGLGQYESVLETVRNAVGRRRRRGPRPQDPAAAPDDGTGGPDREGGGDGVETEPEDG